MFRKLAKAVINRSAALKRLYYRLQIRKGEGIIRRSIESLSKIDATSIHNKQQGNILIVTIPSLPTSVIVDMLLAKALVRLGCDVKVLVVDPCLEADLSCEVSILAPAELIRFGAKKLSSTYSAQKNIAYWEQSGLKLIKLSDIKSSIENVRSFPEISEDILPKIEEHAMAGTLRYFAIGEYSSGDLIQRNVYEKFLASANIMWHCLDLIDSKYNFTTLVCSNGIYVPGGIVNSYAKTVKKRFACWNVAYRKQCLLFSHGDTYHHTLMSEDETSWMPNQYPPNWEVEIDTYLRSRVDGGRDWIVFNKNASFEDPVSIKKRLNIRKPMVLILTNVIWDAQLHYPANAFNSMIEWLDYTIYHFWTRTDLNVVIRIHPAEISGDIPTRQKVSDHIRAVFAELPKHFIIIDADDKTSTYALAQICDTAIIYGTKTGLELTSRGVPVIVCGEAWVRGKGFTIDVNDKTSYTNILNKLPLEKRLEDSTVKKAKEYAYHFFFRRMIPLQSVTVTRQEPRLEISIDDPTNFPTNDRGLMTICNGIIDNIPFVYTEPT